MSPQTALMTRHATVRQPGSGRSTDNRRVSEDPVGYCIDCGVPLDKDHRFCARCGAARWTPEAEATNPPGPSSSEAPATPHPPPTVREQPRPRTPGTVPVAASGGPRAALLGLLPWIYAAGTVFLLVQAAEFMAYFASPIWRAQKFGQLAAYGVPADKRLAWLLVAALLWLALLLVGALMHALGFYGLRRGRRWGWLSAVIVAGFWCLALFGIPVLVLLNRPSVRRAYGVD